MVVQWIRILLPMQGTWVQSLVREDPTCHRAANPMKHNFCSPGTWSLCSATENHHEKKPVHLNKESPLFAATRESPQQPRPSAAKRKKKYFK